MSTVDRTEAAAIATLCSECGVPSLAAGFIAEGVSLDDVKTKVSAIGAVVSMNATARRLDATIPANLGLDMLAQGHSVQEIRTEIFDRMVAEQEKTSISSHVPAPTVGSAGVAASQASMRRTLKASGLTPRDEASA